MRALTGLRVLDFSRVVAGPFCGRILADLGAEVVKIESPEGDSLRTQAPDRLTPSAYFNQVNAGKRGLSLDLKAAGAPALLRRLAEKADVLLENFRVGTLQRFGLGYPQLLPTCPRLIYCSITGYGQSGEWSDRRATAPSIHAETGVLQVAAKIHESAARTEVQSHADFYTGSFATSAILAALYERQRTGVGQHLDLAIAEIATYTNEWVGPELSGANSRTYGVSNTFILRVANGREVALVAIPAQQFDRWVAAMQAPHLLQDARFATLSARLTHRSEMQAMLQQFVGGFADIAALAVHLSKHGLEFAEVRSPAEFSTTAWAAERDLLFEPHPGVRIPRRPWRSSTSQIGATTAAPPRGADNAEVLAEWLDIAPHEVQSLEERRVLSSAR